jgi:fatty acid-binding protein DegV
MGKIERIQAEAIRDAAATATFNIKKLTPIQKKALKAMLEALSTEKSDSRYLPIFIEGCDSQKAWNELERRLTEKLPPARSPAMKRIAIRSCEHFALANQ